MIESRSERVNKPQKKIKKIQTKTDNSDKLKTYVQILTQTLEFHVHCSPIPNQEKCYVRVCFVCVCV